MKYLIHVCGPNGAGKSTFTKTILSRLDLPVVDPDRISSQGISAIQAGKLAALHVNEFIRPGVSFIKESTLSSHFDLKTIEKAFDAGYKNIIIYLSLPSPEIALQRVRRHVHSDCHNVDKNIIERRFAKSLANVALIRHKVCKLTAIDNASSAYANGYKKYIDEIIEEVQLQTRAKSADI